MQATPESWRGRIALMVAHCAGMIDLVALPVWVGALIGRYGFSPPQAGGLATLFLMGAVCSSLIFAPRFNKVDARLMAVIGFAIAAVAFFAASLTSTFASMAICHGIAGASVGCALSFTHGTIAQSVHPHRLFAIVGFALGIFAIFFLGATPNLIVAFGGAALFRTFATVMTVAAVAAALAFPRATKLLDEDIVDEIAHIKPAVWFGIAGISCMALTQSMMFSFLERIGIDRGFGREAVTGVLIAIGFVSLIPAPLAAFLENRLPPNAVLMTGPIVQALVALAIALSGSFPGYAIPAALFAPVMIFTHTFGFGVLAKLDPTSRALAGTPAMLMIGAAIGPILGGLLVQAFGYPALGIAAIVISILAFTLFAKLRSATGSVSGASAMARPVRG